jgi:DUF3102 family protein
MKEIEKSASGWADRIRSAWQSSFDGIIECGRLLAAAKAELEHGEWLLLIETELQFKKRTAQSLITIAQDERFTKATHVALLPPHWGTLAELTRLPDDVFDKKIADGTIHPEMQRKDIAAVAKREHRAEREAELGAKQCALPDKQYGVILADPEWRFEPYNRSSGMDRSARHCGSPGYSANPA